MANRKKVPGVLGWIGRILLGLLLLLVGAIAIGLIREALTRSQVRADFPAPGDMVEIDGHRIHLNCVGEGPPTVVFEADLDQYGSLSWAAVQGPVGETTRACSYDRAGILWSEPGPRPRDGATIAAELKAVLDAAGEQGPYLLVGHAFGGAYTRIFAGMYPDEVSGMVLVESSHPDMLTRFEEFGVKPEIPDASIRPIIWLMSHLGMPSRNTVLDGPSFGDDAIKAFMPESAMAWFDEKVETVASLAQAGQYDQLGNFPLILVVGSRPPNMEQGEELDAAWIEMEEELTALSTNSEMRVFQTGHYPQLQDPDLVIEAIQDVISQIRGE